MSNLYFAYGSNLGTMRLRDRGIAAKPAGPAQLHGHLLRFHKRSKDGSGKANALRTGRKDDVVWGVLFELTTEDLSRLDGFEGRGKGYERVERLVMLADGSEVSCWVYLASADSIDDLLRPTVDYLRLVVDGAREHQLPPEYLRMLEAVQVRD